MTQAVILAGGLGTRLGDLTRTTPKPMLPIDGTPFLNILVSELRRQGCERILIIGGFYGDRVREHFAADSAVTVVIEPAPMGTAGALRFAWDYLDEHFFFLNGDSLFDINLLDLSTSAEGVVATLALRWMPDVSRYGAVECNEDAYIIRFEQRSTQTGRGLINGGIGYFRREILEFIPTDGESSIEKDVYPLLIEKRTLRGRAYDRPFIDIGVPHDYVLSQTKLPELLRRGAVIFDRDGVLKTGVGHENRPDQIRWIEDAVAAVKCVNDAGLLALVATNQAGADHGHSTEADVDMMDRLMVARLRANGANIDGIAYRPAQPAGAIKADDPSSETRRPAPGMINNLLQKHNVDRGRCIMIGSAANDMDTAADAGIEGAQYHGGSLLALVQPWVERVSGWVSG